MFTNYDGYFRGLWVNDPEQLEEFEAEGLNPWPNALLFLPDGNFIRLDVEDGGNGKIVTENFRMVYVVEGNEMEIVAADDPDEEISTARWRKGDQGKLELNMRDTWYRYVPATKSMLRGLGFDISIIEVWAETSEKEGWAYTEAPGFPDD